MSHAHPELGAPPELPADGLRIVPLGGLGDIGRNMTVFEHAGRLMVVDVGVLFPEDAQPGVDLILPDFDLVRSRLDAIEAIVLTHAHEDHIGAVPYLLRERQDIPIYGSRLTLALLASKLREHRIVNAVTHEVVEGDVVQAGPFGLEFVAVNHSIPDALAVFIETAAGTVLHTGDFKLDQLPLDGRITDLRAFARLGERGVDLFMVDSTNAEVPGFVASERDLEPAIDRVFNNARGRIVVASFASHIHRIQQIIDVAHRHHRKIAFFGRSMVRNMGVASDLGYLAIPGGILVSSEQLSELPDDEVVLICTGSQGEPMAALSRIANNDHQIKVGPGDTVVLASSLIPGNENAVSRVINGLTRLGAKVVHKGNAMVHVSGHAAAGELLYCYNIVKPRNVMPIHGEPRHLKANAELAHATGVPAERIVLTLDGGVVDLVGGVAKVTGAVPCGYVYVDGVSVGDLTEASLKDRRVLGSEGFITCFVVVDSVEGKVTAGPEIQARGFVEDESVFDAVLPTIRDAVEDQLRHGNTDQYALQQVVRRVLGRWVNDQHRRRPMIVPVVVEA
ncbi:MAG TPA: ribonuclease J [Candidatus Nanopelagicales bacterium]|nr:ribonuclease J [Candidatus Nanopelagicales bacterium]